MPSTPSDNLRLNLQQTGENLSTWGDKANDEVFLLLEQALTDETDVALSGTATITASNYVVDDARALVLNLTGTGGTLTIPAYKKFYLVKNACTGDVAIGCGGSEADLLAGINGLIYCDATDVSVILDFDKYTQAEVTALIAAAKSEAQAFATAGDVVLNDKIDDLQIAGLTEAQQADLLSAGVVEDIFEDAGASVGDVLIKTADSAEWETPNGTILSSAVTLTANIVLYLLDSSGGSFTITLPASPSIGDKIDIRDVGSVLDENPVTVDRNGETLQGLSEDMILDVPRFSGGFAYTSGGWKLFF